MVSPVAAALVEIVNLAVASLEENQSSLRPVLKLVPLQPTAAVAVLVDAVLVDAVQAAARSVLVDLTQ